MIFSPRFHGFFYLDDLGGLIYAKSSNQSYDGQLEIKSAEWVDLHLQDEFTAHFREIKQVLLSYPNLRSQGMLQSVQIVQQKLEAGHARGKSDKGDQD